MIIRGNDDDDDVRDRILYHCEPTTVEKKWRKRQRQQMSENTKNQCV